MLCRPVTAGHFTGESTLGWQFDGEELVCERYAFSYKPLPLPRDSVCPQSLQKDSHCTWKTKLNIDSSVFCSVNKGTFEESLVQAKQKTSTTDSFYSNIRSKIPTKEKSKHVRYNCMGAN